MSKLQEIKDALNKYNESTGNERIFAHDVIEVNCDRWVSWLIEQLEQAQAANQKLVEGLAWYALKTVYETDVLNQWAPIKPILIDCGQRARQTLSEVKGNGPSKET